RKDSLTMILELGGKTLSESDFQEFMDRKNTWYLEFIDAMPSDEILPGISSFIEELKAHDIKIALGSASKNARRILDRLDLTRWFDAIVDGNDVTHSKPDPEVFQKGAELLNLAPAVCAVIEDSNAGIEAAIRGGFHPVGVNLNENIHGVAVTLPDTSYLKVELLKQF
ncbi:MAG: HAD-IA family hydrolase, partial [Flavobacteriales bacterium]|nr:HAD-IA family hydrolase [Flavobacteriales bacterium]